MRRGMAGAEYHLASVLHVLSADHDLPAATDSAQFDVRLGQSPAVATHGARQRRRGA